MVYQFQEFPKWIISKEGKRIIVQDATEEALYKNVKSEPKTVTVTVGEKGVAVSPDAEACENKAPSNIKDVEKK